MENKMYLEIKNVKKSYGEGGSFVQVLKGVTTRVESLENGSLAASK